MGKLTFVYKHNLRYILRFIYKSSKTNYTYPFKLITLKLIVLLYIMNNIIYYE